MVARKALVVWDGVKGNILGAGMGEVRSVDSHGNARIRQADGRDRYIEVGKLWEIIWRYQDPWPPPLQGESE